MKSKKIILDILLIVLIIPISILLIWTITSRWTYPKLIPTDYSLRGFEYILNTYNIKILINSILISIIVILITIIISIPAAKAISIYEFRGKNYLKF